MPWSSNLPAPIPISFRPVVDSAAESCPKLNYLSFECSPGDWTQWTDLLALLAADRPVLLAALGEAQFHELGNPFWTG